MTSNATDWPDLQGPGWEESRRTLHMFSQIVGKTRLALAPMLNHWWQVVLYVSARGLTTSAMPYHGRSFEVELDLLAHRLEIRTSDGARRGFALAAGGTLAAFHARYFHALRRLGIEVSIRPVAVEVPDLIRLDRDTTPRRYDPDWAERFFRGLVQINRLLAEFRSPFIGKASPVHFFWGGFDMAVTRFSGRRAPLHPGGAPHVADWVMQEAYSHEVSSAGFWPGDPSNPEPAFYSYAYPEPPGFADAPVRPTAARYHPTLREFVLPYDAVRAARSPDREVHAFLASTYEAAAELGRWDRAELERAATTSPLAPSRPPPSVH